GDVARALRRKDYIFHSACLGGPNKPHSVNDSVNNHPASREGERFSRGVCPGFGVSRSVAWHSPHLSSSSAQAASVSRVTRHPPSGLCPTFHLSPPRCICV
ncbi:unnamed protein product, partial [Ascophyllum nodosum]